MALGCLRVCGLLVALVAVALPFSGGLFRALVRLSMYESDAVVGNIVRQDDASLHQQLSGKHVLVVGATRGIGRGVATTLARLGASVDVVGRSRAGGDAVVAKMKSLARSKDQRFAAHAHDLSTVRGAVALFAKLGQAKRRFDYVVMTIGVWPNVADPRSGDGVDKVIALDIVARYVVIREVMPLLNPGARVMSVLASTMKGLSVDMATMKALITGERDSSQHSLMEVISTAASTCDVMIAQASAHYPDVHFIGTHPGFVKSDLFQNTFSRPVLAVMDVAMSLLPILETEEECGLNHANILVSLNALKRPVTFFNSMLDGRHTTPLVEDTEYGHWVWSHLERFVKQHRG